MKYQFRECIFSEITSSGCLKSSFGNSLKKLIHLASNLIIISNILRMNILTCMSMLIPGSMGSKNFVKRKLASSIFSEVPMEYVFSDMSNINFEDIQACCESTRWYP